MPKVNQFQRLRRGTIFTTGESVRQFDSYAPEMRPRRHADFEHTTFVKVSATVALAFEEGRTLPEVQYIPTLYQKCEIVGHIADGLSSKQ